MYSSWLSVVEGSQNGVCLVGTPSSHRIGVFYTHLDLINCMLLLAVIVGGAGGAGQRDLYYKLVGGY
jgi:hypothetical protein